MASGDTKTEAMLNALGNGGSADEFRGCCNTKTQQYILDAIDRVQNVEDEVEELKNNPDVVDIVDTYADLQAYDTQHLTDNDIIRVLADETHSGNSTYYRFTKNPDTWTFIGEIAGGGGGTAGQPKVLTSADNNWNSTNSSTNPPFNCVALWLLPSGYYTTVGGNATVRPYKSSYDNNHTASYLITNNSTVAEIVEFRSTSSLDGTPIRIYRTTVSNGNAAEANPYTEVLTKLMVRDSHGGDTNLPISQAAATHMGNILSTSAPTTSTVGVLGQLMTDTTNMHTYQLTAISGSTYTWTMRW